MILRDYQIQSKDQILDQFHKGNRSVILCNPTGAGKTVTFASIALDAADRGTKTIIVVDRRELLFQAAAKLAQYNLVPEIISSSLKSQKSLTKGLYLATVQTLMNRQIPDVELLIIDEAHKQSFDKIVDKYKGVFVIGVTATPYRTGRMRQLSSLYDAIIESSDIRSLIKAGHLVPEMTFGARRDNSELKTKMGDYDLNQMYNMFDKPVLYDDVVGQYRKFADGTKFLGFCINLQHTYKTAVAFYDAGYNVRPLHSKMSMFERSEILRMYHEDKLDGILNCEILTTGYDEQSIETIIVNRATKSLPLWLQMCGRGARPYPNKDVFNIIDMGGNVYEHGFWSQRREWSLTHKTRKTEGVAPVKECPESDGGCGAIVHASIMTCNYCGFAFPKSELKLTSVEFSQLTPGGTQLPDDLNGRDLTTMDVEELERYRLANGYKLGWIVHQINQRDDITLRAYANHRGFNVNWVDRMKEIYNVA